MNLDYVQSSHTAEVVRLSQDGAIIVSSLSFVVKDIKAVLHSNLWPVAAADSLIVTTEHQKLNRAKNIIASLPPLKNQRFLDFGCGEGHCVTMAKEAALAVGYDPLMNWTERTDLYTEWFEINKLRPFDTILIYDVLDHVPENVAISCLVQARSVLKPGGRIHIRFHPWTARHGTHLYTALNRAYAQFILPPEELQALGMDMSLMLPMTDPLLYYQKLIETTDLKVAEKNVIRHDLPTIFRSGEAYNIFTQRIGGLDAATVLNIDFVDYVLIANSLVL